MRKLFLAVVILFSTLGFSQELTQEGNYTTTVYNDTITQKASFNLKVFTSSMGDIVEPWNVFCNGVVFKK